MGNCKDCKYWKLDEGEAWGKVIGAGACTRAKQFWDSTEWKRYDLDDGFSGETRRVKKDSGDLHYVQDGSDYKAYLITCPEFGCVQFEPSMNYLLVKGRKK